MFVLIGVALGYLLGFIDAAHYRKANRNARSYPSCRPLLSQHSFGPIVSGQHPRSVAKAVVAPCRQVSAMSSYPSGDLYHLGHDQMAAKIAAVAIKKPNRNSKTMIV